jgi:hypothetical protein
MLWIVLIVLIALAAGVLGTLLEIALWAVALTVLVLAAGGLVLARSRSRSNSATRT